jgi:hypothetical protein
VSLGEHLNNPDKPISGLITPTPKSVKCPDNISAKAGTTFTCQVVTADGGKGTVNVVEYKKGAIRVVSGGGALASGQTSTSGSARSSTGTGASTGPETSTGRGTSTGTSTAATTTTG